MSISFYTKCLSLFCGAAVLLSLAGCGAKSEQSGMGAMTMAPPAVRVVSATHADVPLDVAAVGNVESIASVDVKSRIAGQVVGVHFQEGQNVEKGQLLFEIDPEPLHRQQAETQANLTKDLALEQQARANVARDEAQLKQTRAAANRGLELAKEGIFSKEQTEQVVATNDSAEASMAADKAAVESAAAAIRADRARLAQTELQLSFTQIKAPITGRAGAINVKAGNLVKDNDVSLVTLLQMTPIYVTFNLPEQLLPEVRRHQAEHPLQIFAAPQSSAAESGSLSFIDNSVDMATGTIKLKARFENAKQTLWPGEFVNVQARITMEKDRVVVPSRTVQTGPQGKYVWILNPDNSVAMRPIDVARLYKADNGPEESVVNSGLRAGDQVISEGQMKLMPNLKVNVLDQQKQVGESGAASRGPS